MRGKDASRADRRRAARLPHLIEHTAQRRRTAGHRRRTERRDAVARQTIGDERNGIAVGADVERIDAVDTVDVNVDEARDDVVAVKRELRIGVARRQRIGTNVGDATLVYHERARREDRIREHQRRARQNDHGRCAPLTCRAAPIAAASSPSAAVSRRSASNIDFGRRRAISVRSGSSSRSAADAMMPPRTSISGSATTTTFAAAMPRYLAVSRITEIETPSRSRAASSTWLTLIAA